MSKKHYRGCYCKICGRILPNEKFSGKGHANHICNECMRLPVEKRNEMMTVNRIYNLPFRLKKEQKKWLEKMKEDPRADVKDAAEWAWAERFESAPEPDEEEWEVDEDIDLTEEELRELFGEEDIPDEDSSVDIPDDLDTELPFS